MSKYRVPKDPKFKDDAIKVIHHWYLKFYTAPEVAKKTGYPLQFVKDNRPTKVIINRRRAVIEASKSGKTVRELAKVYGCRIGKIRKIVGKKTTTQLLKDNVLKLYSDGYSLEEVSRIVDMPKSVVKETLELHEITLDPFEVDKTTRKLSKDAITTIRADLFSHMLPEVEATIKATTNERAETIVRNEIAKRRREVFNETIANEPLLMVPVTDETKDALLNLTMNYDIPLEEVIGNAVVYYLSQASLKEAAEAAELNYAYFGNSAPVVDYLDM